jgi:hypothetical protein
MKKYTIFIIIVTLVLIYFFFPSGDDSREIEIVIQKTMAAGKKKDLEGMMKYFSIDYRDDYGLNYYIVKNIIKTFLDRFDSFNGKYSDLKVSMNETKEGEKQAVANLDIAISGVRSGFATDILGSTDSPKNLTVTLTKSRLTGWEIVKVEGVELKE